MAYLEGNTIRISIGETVIGGQQNCSLNRETETTETTTKDSGIWAESEATGLSWSVDCDGLVVVGDEGLEALKTAWRTRALVNVKSGTATNYEGGQAIIESLSQNSPQKEKCTYSVSLKGCGALTETKPTALKESK